MSVHLLALKRPIDAQRAPCCYSPQGRPRASAPRLRPRGDSGQAAHIQHSTHTIGLGTSPSLTSSLVVPTAIAV